ncbi:hypothetical protein KY290_005036 [Solanum tuberosum]|uniref:Uncharacterized protein n=1 Tax=Solanum tuberosum TaxID=4113 RepID=A0ABQ7WCY5_SOLTU|nr:hypothetical protein KY289_005404 [Solanum tuberosum]KAH0778609.1 hypothetical protein KY290_005036 [Solanum tuberosum]
MEAAPVKVEVARPSSVAARDLLCCCDGGAGRGWWGAGRGWWVAGRGWVGVGSKTSLRF